MLRRIVYLVGAGPGAPDLISARGLQCLQAADVVIYDHLVHARLLQAAPAGAERIDVGSAAPERLDQDAICYLIGEKARENKLIVRLKWGDPFVFDQGAVEALFLHEQGIPFEVVPGVPAAVGVPAYAGVPVTYPGGGDTFTLVRGYEDEGRGHIEVDWEALARLGGTIACYAGPGQLTAMIDALIANGRPAAEPAAVVTDGTLLKQRTRYGTLEELARDFRQQGPAAPALLVVGKVVGLRDHLRWFDGRPLFGRRVLVTRSREQAAEIVDLLEACGAEVIEGPVVGIAPPDDHAPLDQACADAGRFDWIVFTSANAAAAFMNCLLSGTRDVRALAGARLCAVGPDTASRLTRFGLNVDLVPTDHRSAAVLRSLDAVRPLKGARVLFVAGDAARDTLAEELSAAGANVTDVIAYRIVTVEGDAHLGIYRQLLDRRIDAVTFSSATAVRAFMTIYGDDQAVDLLSHTVVAALGPATIDAARRYGITPQVAPEEATIPALVDALVAYFQAAVPS
ncbi:MAG: uroporphyrinogen-III C-methyltransferase [Acidobacteriota bacterium]